MQLSNLSVIWNEAREVFSWGGLFDIYIAETTREDWQACINLLQRQRLPLTFQRAGQQQPLPQDIADAYMPPAGNGPYYLLSVDLHGIILNTTFYSEDEIELDLDPKDVTSEARFTVLVEFLADLARELRKPVRLTFESAPQMTLFTVFPDGTLT